MNPSDPSFNHEALSACRAGHQVLVCRVLDHSNLDKEMPGQMLIPAATNRQVDVVKKILFLYADNINGDDLKKALIGAVSQGFTDIAKQITAYEMTRRIFNPLILGLALCYAAGRGHIDCVTLLLDNYAGRIPIRLPVIISVKCGHQHIVEQFRKYESDVAYFNSLLNTELDLLELCFFCNFCGIPFTDPLFHHLMLKTCEESRPAVDQTSTEQTLLQAVEAGQMSHVETVLSSRAMNDEELGKALVRAVSKGHIVIAKKLTLCETTHEVFSSDNLECALMYAAGWGHIDCVTLLMDTYAARISAEIKTIAMNMSVFFGREQMSELLRKYGIDSTAPLRRANFYEMLKKLSTIGDANFVELFLSSKELTLNMSCEDLGGVMSRAVMNGHHEIVVQFLNNKDLAPRILVKDFYQIYLKESLVLATAGSGKETALTLIRAFKNHKIRLSVKNLSRMLLFCAQDRNCNNELKLEILNSMRRPKNPPPSFF